MWQRLETFDFKLKNQFDMLIQQDKLLCPLLSSNPAHASRPSLAGVRPKVRPDGAAGFTLLLTAGPRAAEQSSRAEPSQTDGV